MCWQAVSFCGHGVQSRAACSSKAHALATAAAFVGSGAEQPIPGLRTCASLFNRTSCPACQHPPACLPAPGLQVSLLRSQLEAKGKQLTGLQADMQALQGDAEARLGGCEKQLLAYKERCSVLKQEVEAEHERSAKASRPAGDLVWHAAWFVA